MPSENEEMDVIKDRRWMSFVDILRGDGVLDDEAVVGEFDRRLVNSLQRVFKLLPVPSLVMACITNDQAKINQILNEHRRQRHRAAAYAEMVVKVCHPGMMYPDCIDSMVSGVCDIILSQAETHSVPSSNFPTFNDYTDAQSRWRFMLAPRLGEIIDQLCRDPRGLRVVKRPGNVLRESLIK